MNVLAFGEVLFDIYPSKRVIGGAPLNFAAHFVRCGGEAALMSAVGDDELGKKVLSKLEGWRVSTDCVAVSSAYPTGTCVVTLDEQSVPSYCLTDDVAWDHIPFAPITRNEFDVLYLGTLALRNEHNRQTVEKLLVGCDFGDVFADVNIRPPFYCKETIDFVLRSATIVKISEEELPLVLGLLGLALTADPKAVAKQLISRFDNLRVVIITRGENGAAAYDRAKGRLYTVEAVKTQVVSTVGAGDSFSAAFLYAYLNKDDMVCCLETASRVAASVVSCYEAIPDVM